MGHFLTADFLFLCFSSAQYSYVYADRGRLGKASCCASRGLWRPSSVEMQMDNVRYVVEGIIIPPISLVGLVGNTLTIIVLNHNDVKLKRSLVDVLCGLATFDNLFLLSIFPLFTMPSLSEW